MFRVAYFILLFCVAQTFSIIDNAELGFIVLGDEAGFLHNSRLLLSTCEVSAYSRVPGDLNQVVTGSLNLTFIDFRCRFLGRHDFKIAIAAERDLFWRRRFGRFLQLTIVATTTAD